MQEFIDGLNDLFNSCSGTERVMKTEEFSLGETVKNVNLTGWNGSISWLPLADGEIPRIVVEKEVRGGSAQVVQDCLASLKIEEERSEENVTLRVKRPHLSLRARLAEVCFTVYASPQQFNDFRAETSNGRIEIAVKFACNLTLGTSNGRITLEKGSGSVQLDTSNGRIDLGQIQLTDSSRISTSNGTIDGNVSFPGHGQYTFATSNGRISLRVPQETPGAFHILTSNGRIDVNLGGEVISGRGKVSVMCRPGPEVRITTSNGAVTLQGTDF